MSSASKQGSLGSPNNSRRRASRGQRAADRDDRQLVLCRARAEWPEGPAFNPHHFAAVTGWHCAEASGAWDTAALVDSYGSVLVHSSLSGADGSWHALVFAPHKGLFITVGRHAPEHILLRVWASSPEAASREFQQLQKSYFEAAPSSDRSDYADFFVVTLCLGEPIARKVSVLPKLRTADQLRLNYGQDFLDWHLEFVHKLRTVSGGLTLLEGEPGVGKTSYLRHLICELRRTHRSYFLPISSFSLLAAPGCVDFWLRENASSSNLRKVVIIEDAEPLLLRRGADNREALSNLLNIADGLLGDYLKVHVICTVNTALDDLDPAIVRPGRLIASHRFRRLAPPEARRLATTLKLKLPPQASYSLAEIYSRRFTSERLSDGKAPVGFAAPAQLS